VILAEQVPAEQPAATQRIIAQTAVS
jgi:hypothetical protein